MTKLMKGIFPLILFKVLFNSSSNSRTLSMDLFSGGRFLYEQVKEHSVYQL